jgi:hypothetical protein
MLPNDYLFIADTQVDLLYAQAAGQGGDSAPAAEAGEGPDVRAQKLDAVIRHLEAQEPVGTIEKPGAYFRGTMKMQWGVVEETALFVGEQTGEQRLFVLLGGPAGAPLAADEAAGSSERIPPQALAGLFALFERADPEAAVPAHHYMAPDNLDARLLRRLPWLAEQLDAVQTVTFLAETLSVMASDDRYSSARDILVVGSPLYVAVAEPEE